MNRPPYLLLGSEPIGPIALRALERAEYPPAAYITDTKLKTDELIDLVEAHKAACILVVGFGAILRQPLLDSVAGQVLNIHPSLLPAYRGPAPVVQTILDDARETGVTLIEIDTKMDHGPILAQTTHPLRGNETPTELYEILTAKGVDLFLACIDKYLEEELDLTPQMHEEATITHFIKKEDGHLNLHDSAKENECKIRAFQGWPGTWIEFEGKRLIIHQAHLEQGKLRFDEVQPENGKRMSFAAYCTGLRRKENEVYTSLEML